MKGKKRGIERVPGVARAFAILEHLARAGAANPSEAARALKLPRTGVLRILTTLADLGYARYVSESGQYDLTAKLLSLGAQAGPVDLVQAARPHLTRLRDESGETAELAVIDGDELLFVETLDSPQSIRLHARPGRRFPLHRMATGRVLLAGLESGTVRRLYESGKVEHAPWKVEGGLKGLSAMLARIAEQGYALDGRYAREDVERIAAPVRDAGGAVVAAVAIAGPAFRLEVTPARIGLVRSVAAAISRELGFVPARAGGAISGE
ncbi:MAG: IclR family transcriptional regulator [Kiritimatiellae bacterium]|nr:IclR family transcriptional regulator [Kiritimatiellia bacterium]